jgi:hypothetical protein
MGDDDQCLAGLMQVLEEPQDVDGGRSLAAGGTTAGLEPTLRRRRRGRPVDARTRPYPCP